MPPQNPPLGAGGVALKPYDFGEKMSDRRKTSTDKKGR
jgi:hypothetical protein